MHTTVIPEAAKEFSKKIRGEGNPLPLIPGKFAHIIVDLQKGFMAPGSVAETPMNLEIIPTVNKISVAARNAGGLNVFLKFTYDPNWKAFYGRFAPGHAAPLTDAFTEGAEQHELWPGLDIKSDDLILNKTRFSALIPGTCDMDAALQSRGIDTIVVTGCVSNCCCESTIRDAMQMNYNVIFVEDGNAAASDADHNGAVADLFGIFGCDICTGDEVIDRMKGAVNLRRAG